MNTTLHEPTMSPAPVKSAAEAGALVAPLVGVMGELADVLQQETEHVGAGRVSAASGFTEHKSDLSRRYVAGTLKLKASKLQLVAPDRRAALQARHEALRTLLKTNMT